MNVTSIQSKSSKSDAAEVPLTSLAGNKSLTENQKIAEASQQFEAIMLRQILSESQKPVIQSEFTDNSTSAGIYQDFVTNQMAESMAKSGAVGFARVFERQLDRPDASKSKTAEETSTTRNSATILSIHHE